MKTSLCPRALMLSAVSALCLLMVAESVTASAAESRLPEVPKRVLDFIKPVPVEGDELRQKLVERHNAAVSLLEARADSYRKSICDLSSLLDAARLVVEAKLDLAENENARTRVFEDTLEVAKLIEDRARQLMEKGLGSKADYERARLGRLSVEVQILKAKRGRKP
jgi:hypothetical protein